MAGLITIIATANRIRNGIRFVKKIAQSLDVSKFSEEQIEKFKNDPKLKVTFDEPQADDDKKDDLSEAEQEKLVALLNEFPEAELTKAGKPNLTYVKNTLGFAVDALQLEAALLENASAGDE